MAITESQALVDLTNLTEMYYDSLMHYNEQYERVQDFVTNSEDESFRTYSAAPIVLSAQAAVAASYDRPLQTTLQEFTETVGTSASSIITLAQDLIDYMNDNSKEVKSRGVTYTTSSPVSFTGTGDQKLYVCSKEEGNYENEAVTIETIKWTLTKQASKRSTRGQETYQVTGEGRADRSEFDGRGTGISNTVMFGYEAGSKQSIIKNSSFDNAFSGASSSTTKIPFWDIEASATNIASSTTQTAKDRGKTHRALAITGTCKIRFYFRKHGIELTRLRPFIGAFRAYDDCSSGTIVARVGAGGSSNWTKTYNASGGGSWSTEVLDPDTQYAWANNFDTDGNPYFEIECTSAPTGGNTTIYIDDVFFAQMQRVGGRYVAIISGTTDGVYGDYAEHACDLTYGSGSVQLTGGGSGSVDSITVDTVDYGTIELLDAAVDFNSSLNQTASDVADAINEHRTFPNFVASVSTDTVTIEPEVPLEGTLTVTSSATTITTSDTDVTGGSLGKTADFFARRAGISLRHASSATSGWGV